MFTNINEFLKVLLKATIQITISGIIIGLFHKYDIIIALLLALRLIYGIYKRSYLKQPLILMGIILTGVGGIIGEYWGVSNTFWEYHNINHKLPYWLPFAWMLAFCFLYKLEEESFALLKNKTFTNKAILTLFFVFFYPAYGEVITIALGVWTYYWPYQILGVPLYAFLCLIFLHSSINLLLVWINKKYNFKNDVFTF